MEGHGNHHRLPCSAVTTSLKTIFSLASRSAEFFEQESSRPGLCSQREVAEQNAEVRRRELVHVCPHPGSSVRDEHC